LLRRQFDDIVAASGNGGLNFLFDAAGNMAELAAKVGVPSVALEETVAGLIT
jgi:hypothetical protein